jgi:hypothetical protein
MIARTRPRPCLCPARHTGLFSFVHVLHLDKCSRAFRWQLWHKQDREYVLHAICEDSNCKLAWHGRADWWPGIQHGNICHNSRPSERSLRVVLPEDDCLSQSITDGLCGMTVADSELQNQQPNNSARLLRSAQFQMF